VHLAIWMPFERATEMQAELTGVQTSEATARRRSYRVGEAALEVEKARANSPAPEVPEEIRKAKHIVSPDGAMVPLLHGQWAEEKHGGGGTSGGRQARGGDSQRRPLLFLAHARCEKQDASRQTRNCFDEGLKSLEQVSAVMDGAEWIDGFVDWLCPHVLLRILDFPHAGEYVNEIGKLTQAAGSVLEDGWLKSHLHDLKHDGPATVLEELRELRDRHPQVEEIGKKLGYLEKRETRMQYPLYQAQGWPIGSGIVESGNKVVMQARLKGPGMHWAPPHVNPLLALRCGACSNRWDETYKQAHNHHQKQRVIERNECRDRRYLQNLQVLNIFLLMCKWRSSKPEPIAAVPIPPSEKHVDNLASPDARNPAIHILHTDHQSVTLSLSDASNTTITMPSLERTSSTPSMSTIHNTTIPISSTEKLSNSHRPSATHPWRRRLLAKK
jgi:hypothetical protein